MTTPITPVVTDELIAELEAAADYAANQVIRSHGWEGTVDEFADGMLGADERYMRWAEPATILALLAERAELKQQLAAASVDADRWRYAKADTSAGKSDICVVKKIWGDGRKDTQEIILTEADADAAVDAAIDIAAMDIGSGD